jgi:hypothetical protein
LKFSLLAEVHNDQVIGSFSGGTCEPARVQDNIGAGSTVCDGHGLRAVGIAENGVITEVYAFIVDLSFRSGTDGATISLCTDDKSVLSVPLDDSFEEERLRELLGALRIVFFDTDTLTILITASLAAQDAKTTENSIAVQLVSDGAPLALTQATAGKDCNVSLLFYLDGMQINNSGIVAAASHSMSRMTVNLTFTDK